MIGAIAGDMIGAPYERYPIKHKDFDPLVHGFTDDTVLTVAVAHAILTGQDMADSLKRFARNITAFLTVRTSANGCGRGKPALQQLRQRCGHAGLAGGVRL